MSGDGSDRSSRPVGEAIPVRVSTSDPVPSSLCHLGDKDNLVPVKQFVSRKEAEELDGHAAGRTAWVL